MTLRVAVVDDDDITRWGTAAILSSDPELEVVRSVSHAEAAGPWDGVDVAVVDASDHRAGDDQFPGVGVVESIRRDGGARCTVIVLTGVLADDAVRRRMREAGADFYYHRSELGDAMQLIDIVAGRCERVPVPEPADSEALFRLGITARTRVNEAIAAAAQHGLNGGDPAVSQRGRGRVRRREAFNERARLNTVTSSGQPPERNQDAPSLPQIDRFLRWATRADQP